MMAGRYQSHDVDVKHVFEAVGQYTAGRLTDQQLQDLELAACPGCGSCSGLFTANSMNCLTEALGMGLPGNGTVPAIAAARLRLAKRAGMQIMELVRRGILPGDIMTEPAFENAIAVDIGKTFFTHCGGKNSCTTAIGLPQWRESCLGINC